MTSPAGGGDPDEPLSKFKITVGGEEIDHADTKGEAKRYRDAIIYGGIGTEANTKIERRTSL